VTRHLRYALLAAAFAMLAPVARAETDPQPPVVDDEEVEAPVEDIPEPIFDEPPAPPETVEPPAPPPVKKAPAPPKKPIKKTGRLDKTEDTVAGGQHWRVETDAGAIHVWVPPGYDRATAGTVVYVHGYYTNSDGAWKEHNLARQFKASGQNALFIVPDAPSGNDESVKWPALADLRKAISRANIKMPDGPIIVMGHSGAFRTVMQWVDHRLVAEVILLDALYGGDRKFDDFIGTGKRAQYHKLIIVGSDTSASSSAFAKKYPFAVTRDRMPGSTAELKKREKSAKLFYIKSQYGHMQIVTGGKVIPMLLRLTPLKHR
jgi:hypothetical protein